jgi:hypothetical protein
MGYDGAPSLEDLEGLTIFNAVEASHRIVEAGRQFFLALHGQPRFQRLGLVPYSGITASFETELQKLLRSPSDLETPAKGRKHGVSVGARRRAR